MARARLKQREECGVVLGVSTWPRRDKRARQAPLYKLEEAAVCEDAARRAHSSGREDTLDSGSSPPPGGPGHT